ncbi:hypothetical protein WKH79_07585 [Qipengyuania sp. GPGPB31]|uniref:hypothetical protein n=1 Tax=Qipengyuania sp. GPGPB31 TaxID=3023518 RepID=UPI003134403C
MTRLPFQKATMVLGALVLPFGAGLAAQGGETQDQSPEAEAVTEQKAKTSDRMICKTVRSVRSRAIKNEVCMTKKQWLAAARQGNGLARSIVRGAASGQWDVLDRDDGAT